MNSKINRRQMRSFIDKMNVEKTNLFESDEFKGSKLLSKIQIKEIQPELNGIKVPIIDGDTVIDLILKNIWSEGNIGTDFKELKKNIPYFIKQFNNSLIASIESRILNTQPTYNYIDEKHFFYFLSTLSSLQEYGCRLYMNQTTYRKTVNEKLITQYITSIGEPPNIMPNMVENTFKLFNPNNVFGIYKRQVNYFYCEENENIVAKQKFHFINFNNITSN